MEFSSSRSRVQAPVRSHSSSAAAWCIKAAARRHRRIMAFLRALDTSEIKFGISRHSGLQARVRNGPSVEDSRLGFRAGV